MRRHKGREGRRGKKGRLLVSFLSLSHQTVLRSRVKSQGINTPSFTAALALARRSGLAYRK